MKSKILIAFICFIALSAAIFALSNRNTTDKKLFKDKIQVTASFYPLWYFATQIGGDKVEVKNITPAGLEPHDYEPTVKDIVYIQKSNLLIVHGGNFEPWFAKIKQNISGKTKYVEVGNDLSKTNIADKNEQTQDPHTWLDPIFAKLEAERIMQSLAQYADPVHAQYYQVNYNKLAEKFAQLDASYRKGLAHCMQKDFVTSHAAFAYLAQEYGLHQVSIAGLSPDEEPSSKKLAEIADYAKKNTIKYIFSERLVNTKFSETIANEAGAKTLVLDPLEGLSDDDIKQGRNYFTVMGDNLRNLQKALQCKT